MDQGTPCAAFPARGAFKPALLLPIGARRVANGDLVPQYLHQIRQIVVPQRSVDAIGQLLEVFAGGDHAGPGVQAVLQPDRGKQAGFERGRVQHRRPCRDTARPVRGEM